MYLILVWCCSHIPQGLRLKAGSKTKFFQIPTQISRLTYKNFHPPVKAAVNFTTPVAFANSLKMASLRIFAKAGNSLIILSGSYIGL